MASIRKKKAPAKAARGKTVKPKAKLHPKVKARPKAKARSKAKAAAKASPKPAAKLKVETRPAAKILAKSRFPLKSAPVAKAPKPPRHVASPVPKAEQKEVREKLVTLLEQLQSNIQQEVKGASERDLAHITDSSDMASDSAEGDLAFRIAESEGVNATEVQKAIAKIDEDSYGVCERCNRSIGAERMRFLPFATMCIRCQELTEIRRKEDEEDELGDLADAAEENHEEA
jgi:RNA polymerase-binding protein DksA